MGYARIETLTHYGFVYLQANRLTAMWNPQEKCLYSPKTPNPEPGKEVRESGTSGLSYLQP